MVQYLYQIHESTVGFYKDKGSQFHAYAFPVDDVESVKNYLQVLKKKYYDARHHCYAYRLGLDGATEFATDDREPAHSAGPPILAAIKGKDVTNILIVVVRYFGGTKLGIRGLIEAYKAAAENALRHADLVIQIPRVSFEITYTYEQTSEVNRIFHRFNLDKIDAKYTDICRQRVGIEQQYFDQIYQILIEGGIEVRIEHKPDNS